MKAPRRLFSTPFVLIIASCGGPQARPGESAESAACRAIDVGDDCDDGAESCHFDADYCDADMKVCSEGKWTLMVTTLCNPPPPR
jgi:hypothetical protein